MTLLTIGHGTLPQDDFLALARDAGIELVVDVRTYPGSRHNPQFGRDVMAEWLPAGGIAYRWERRLGGRRKPAPDTPNVALRHEGFRGYADHMASADFRAALDEVLASPQRTAVMCSESVWWRCHRRLLADHATLVEGVAVRHLMHDGRLTDHAPTDGVRVEGDGLVYDVGVERPLL